MGWLSAALKDEPFALIKRGRDVFSAEKDTEKARLLIWLIAINET
jgi:hypothetical protein